MHFPILTSLIALPVVGAILLLFVRGDEEQSAPFVRKIALIVSLLVFAETLLLWSRFNPASADFQFVERHAWIPAFGITYFVGVDGISLLLLVLTGFLTPLALLSSWESVHKKTKAFCIFVLLLESAMMGVFVSLDLFLFYVLLGRDARADVFPHRHLGLRPAHLRGDQVHPLHDGRQRPDAAGDPRPGVPALHDDRQLQLRPAEAVRAAGAAASAVLVLPRLRAGVRDQGAAVPVPHLAARRARRGADRRLGDPRGRAAEDGHLRPRAVRVSAVPGGGGVLRARARRARRRRHHLRRAGRDGAAGHEEAGGLFERQPSRLRRARHRGDEHAGRAGRRLPDAQSRRQHRRPLPDRRHAVGSAAHAADRGVRRPEEGDAASGGGVPDRDAVVDRPAGPERLRRRVPDSARRVPLGSAHGGVRGDRRDPVGHLHALDVPARELRPGDQREERAPCRSAAARVGGHRADRRAGRPDGRAAEPVPAADRAVGRAAGEPIPSRAHRRASRPTPSHQGWPSPPRVSTGWRADSQVRVAKLQQGGAPQARRRQR